MPPGFRWGGCRGEDHRRPAAADPSTAAAPAEGPPAAGRGRCSGATQHGDQDRAAEGLPAGPPLWEAYPWLVRPGSDQAVARGVARLRSERAVRPLTLKAKG